MDDVAQSVMRASWRSPAKVNLSLRIVGRRPDGYHLLDSVFAAVDLCDDIAVAVRDLRAGAEPVVEVRCDRPDVPTDARNLAARAARVLLCERGIGARVAIDLEKRIPPGSGLGGGSSNAATVLAGLNARLGLGVEPLRLRELALSLGADVPFFLDGGVARVGGVGELVEPIAWSDLHLVLAIPSVAVSTAWAFEAYDERAASSAPGDEAAPRAAGLVPDGRLFVNALEAVVFARYPELATLKRDVLAAGAAAAVMSGSGSAILGSAPSPPAAHRIADTLVSRRSDVRVEVVSLFTRGVGEEGPGAGGSLAMGDEGCPTGSPVDRYRPSH